MAKKKETILPFTEPETKFEKIYGKNQKTRPKDRFKIIHMINGLTNQTTSEIKLKIKIPEQIHFSCNTCGKCCKNVKFRIPVSISDIAKWIEANKKNYLRVLDHNRGHPKSTFFLTNKIDLIDHMEDDHGKFFLDYFVKLNPSLNDVLPEDEGDCVYYNSIRKECVIYSLRPLYCSIYPYNLILGINFESLFAKAYKKVSRMQLKDREYKNYIKRAKNEVALCPPVVLEQIPSNLKTIKKQKLIKRIKKFIVSGLFSGSLYFRNRIDISEEVFTSIFSKNWNE